jgi:amino acid transporter
MSVERTTPTAGDVGSSAPVGGGLAAGRLGTADLVAQSLAVGPITSAALLGGIVAAKGGSAGPLYLLVVTVGILGLGAILVTFARRYTHAGAMYEYVGRTLGPAPAIATAGFYYLAYIILGGPTMLIGAGVLGADLFKSYLGLDVPFWLAGLGMLVVVTLINLRGVEMSVRAQLVIFLLSVIPYLVIAVVVIAKGGAAGNSAAVFDPTAPTAGDFMPTFMFAALLFVGVESAASLGEEAKDPRRAVPRAIILTILIVAAFCFLMQYAGTIGFGLGAAADQWASDPLGLSTLGNRYVGDWIAPFAQLGLVLDMIAVCVGFMAASSRGLYALSRGGLLPPAVGRLTRWHTPVTGIVIFFVTSVVALAVDAIVSSRTGMDPYVGFGVTSTLGGLLVVVAYLVLIVAAGALLVRGQWRPAGWVAVVLAAVTVLAGLVGTIAPLPPDASRYGVYAAGILLVAAVVWGVYHGVIRKHTLPDLKSVTAEVEPHAPDSHLI